LAGAGPAKTQAGRWLHGLKSLEATDALGAQGGRPDLEVADDEVAVEVLDNGAHAPGDGAGGDLGR
jgi:hypothetical protein